MKYFLVYQAGIANIFKVKTFNLSPFGRHAGLVYQGDFRTAEAMGRGMQLAGATVRTAACNMAGDISNATWTSDLESQPFSKNFHPINPDKDLHRIWAEKKWKGER